MSDLSKQSSKNSKRSSRSVVQRKKEQTRLKYNAIGISKQQARIAAVNVIHIDDVEVDLTDAFDFVTWYLEHVEPCVEEEGGIPFGQLVIQFKDNLYAMDLSGRNRSEKVGLIFDIVRSPILQDICREAMVDTEAIDAVSDIPLISFDSDESPSCLSELDPLSVQNTACDVVEFGPPSVVKDKPIDFIRDSTECGVIPVIGCAEWEKQARLPDDERYTRACAYTVYWNLVTFRRLFITDARYHDWLDERSLDVSQRLNVRICTAHGYHQYKFLHFYVSHGCTSISDRSEFRGLLGISKGIGVVTGGEDGCELNWV